jgi:hypothetical protein
MQRLFALLSKLDGIFNPNRLGPNAISSKISTWVVETKDTDSANHWQAFKNPEEPLMAECICVSPSSKFNDSKDAADLSS